MTLSSLAIGLFAGALLAAGGRGLLEVIAPGVARSSAERWSLAFLLGTGLGTWAAWWAAYFSLPVSRATGLIGCVAAAVLAGWLVRRRAAAGAAPDTEVRASRARALTTGLTLILAAVCGGAILLAVVTPLGWDGLFNFEIKARLAHTEGLQGLLSYFGDRSRDWSHPQYPLLVPLAEAWVYAWAGTPDQQAVKLLFPAFFLSLIGLLHGALRQESGTTLALAGCAALALMPSFTIGPGGATTGYADIPLAAFIFGAVVHARRALDGQGARSAVIAGLLAGGACWTKPEGTVLAGCLALATAVIAVTERRHVTTLVALLVGPALVIVPWWLVQSRYGIPDTLSFLPVSPGTFASYADRWPTVIGLMSIEFWRAGRWAALWPAFAVMSLACARPLRRSADFLLTAMVVGPLAAYSLVFVMSALPDYRDHVLTALPRLFLHVAPIAWFATLRHLHLTLVRQTPVALEARG